MILHTVKTSPFQTFALADCVKLMAKADTLLLIEDAVIASQAQNPCYKALKLLSDEGRLMVLKADLDARGIENSIGKALLGPCPDLFHSQQQCNAAGNGKNSE